MTTTIIPSGALSTKTSRDQITLCIPWKGVEVEVNLTVDQSLIVIARVNHAVKEALQYRKHQTLSWNPK